MSFLALHTAWETAAALAAGLAAGAVHFFGLWLTLRRLPVLRRPRLTVLASLLGRTVASVVLVWAATGGRPLLVAAAMTGFLAARTLILRRFRPAETGGR